MKNSDRQFRILLVEDDPGDRRLTQEALKESDFNYSLEFAEDGEEAVNYLEGKGNFSGKPRPDIILLDYNLPKKNGDEVLEIIKGKKEFRTIPVIILTNSNAQNDIYKSYSNYANCFVTKPVDLDEFMKVIKDIITFWFYTVSLPSQEN